MDGSPAAPTSGPQITAVLFVLAKGQTRKKYEKKYQVDDIEQSLYLTYKINENDIWRDITLDMTEGGQEIFEGLLLLTERGLAGGRRPRTHTQNCPPKANGNSHQAVEWPSFLFYKDSNESKQNPENQL